MTGQFVNSTGTVTIPQTSLNITLTNQGKEIEFDFPSADAGMITSFEYLVPHDDRCKAGLFTIGEDNIHKWLKPVLGSQHVELTHRMVKRCVISLHRTVILAYQLEEIIDPRMDNVVAKVWSVYLDNRIFPMVEDKQWLASMGELITADEDEALANSIKDRLLEHART